MGGRRLVLVSFVLGIAAFGGPSRADEPPVPAAAPAPAPGCKTIIERFAGKDITIIDRSDIRKRSGLVRVKDLFGKDKQEVFMGFAGEDGTFLGGAGHAYLMVGDTRYDGNLLFTKAVKREETNTLNDGLIIRFPDVSPETIESLKKQLSSSKFWTHRSLSCVPGVCNQLRRGADINGGGYHIFASAIFKSLVTEGFKDAQGNPVKIEIYRTNDKTLDFYYRGLQTKRRKGLKALAVISGIGTAVGGAGYGIYALVSDDDSDKAPDKNPETNPEVSTD